MRKLLLVVLLFASSLMASEIHWAKDFKSGVAEATKLKKPILFVFSRHSCKYCVILEKKTFRDKRVIKALKRDFVSIVSYTDENDYTPRELWRPGTPTIWFLQPNGVPMFQPLVGAVGPDDFLRAVAIVKEEFDSREKNIKSGKK